MEIPQHPVDGDRGRQKPLQVGNVKTAVAYTDLRQNIRRDAEKAAQPLIPAKGKDVK